MHTVTISENFEIDIPEAVRDQLQLMPGLKLQFIAYGGRAVLIPVRPMKSFRGFLRGIDTGHARPDDVAGLESRDSDFEHLPNVQYIPKSRAR